MAGDCNRPPPTTGTAPCFQCANFVETDFPGYDPTKPHTIRLEMRFIPGPSNDVVALYVHGKLVHIGTAPRMANLDVTEHAAWTTIAQMLLNLDESIMRE